MFVARYHHHLSHVKNTFKIVLTNERFYCLQFIVTFCWIYTRLNTNEPTD